MGYDAATAIRNFLEENEGSTDAQVGQLLTSFEVPGNDPEGQAAIERTLLDHGIELDRTIVGLAANDPVALRLAVQTPVPEETPSDAPWPSMSAPQSPAEAQVAPEGPEVHSGGHGAPPSRPPQPGPSVQPPNSSNGGWSGFIRRRPRAVFWATLGVALFVGIAIGAAGASDPQIEKDLAQAKSELRDTQSDLAASREQGDEAQTKLAAASDRVRELTAKGEVPNLKGKDPDSVQETLDEYDWTLATRRQVSSATPGTIIGQSPTPGTVLKAGKEIQVTVAKPAPPSWKPVLSLSGSGSKRTDEFNIPAGKKVRVQYTFNGETNDTIQVKDPSSGDEDFGDLIFNEIGTKSGTTRLYGAEGPTYLDISGDSWTIQVQVYK